MLKYFSLFLLLAAVAVARPAEDEAEEGVAEDLEGAESQSFGYGYGTKVEDQYSTATGKSTSITIL